MEDLTDAYHLRFGDQEVMVAYLLEVRRQTKVGAVIAKVEPLTPARALRGPFDYRLGED